MATKELIEYLRGQVDHGVSRDDVRHALLAYGWREQDIDAGFTAIGAPAVPIPTPPRPTTSVGNGWKLMGGITLGIIVLAGVGYLVAANLSLPETTPTAVGDTTADAPPTAPVEPPPVLTAEQPVEPAAQDVAPETTGGKSPQNEILVLANNLQSCAPYKATFRHLFTKDILEREIIGIVEGKCRYVEQMPNGGKLECAYSESERLAVAQYYKNLAAAESFGTTADEQGVTYTIDGQVVANPLDEVLTSGACVITGYN